MSIPSTSPATRAPARGLTGDIRYCIDQADLPVNAGSTINFNLPKNTTITLTNGELYLSANTTINNAAGLSSNLTISGGNEQPYLRDRLEHRGVHLRPDHQRWQRPARQLQPAGQPGRRHLQRRQPDPHQRHRRERPGRGKPHDRDGWPRRRHLQRHQRRPGLEHHHGPGQHGPGHGRLSTPRWRCGTGRRHLQRIRRPGDAQRRNAGAQQPGCWAATATTASPASGARPFPRRQPTAARPRAAASTT